MVSFFSCVAFCYFFFFSFLAVLLLFAALQFLVYLLLSCSFCFTFPDCPDTTHALHATCYALFFRGQSYCLFFVAVFSPLLFFASRRQQSSHDETQHNTRVPSEWQPLHCSRLSMMRARSASDQWPEAQRQTEPEEPLPDNFPACFAISHCFVISHRFFFSFALLLFCFLGIFAFLFSSFAIPRSFCAFESFVCFFFGNFSFSFLCVCSVYILSLFSPQAPMMKANLAQRT